MRKITLLVLVVFSGLIVCGYALSDSKTLRCAMCTKKFKPDSKTAYIIYETKDDKTRQCCCAHCGIMLQEKIKKQVKSAQTKDYGTGSKIDAADAYYVVKSKDQPCCCPSILAFKDRKAAEKFKEKKEGTVLSYKEVVEVMQGKRKLPKVKT